MEGYHSECLIFNKTLQRSEQMSHLGAPVQFAYLVSDIFEGIEKWIKNFGSGPFFISEHVPIKNIFYRGYPSKLDITVAYAQWGSVMIELIQNNNNEPSVMTELVALKKGVFHHVAFFVEDLNLSSNRLKNQGYELAMTGQAGDNRFQFFDALDKMGHFIEIYEPVESLVDLYERVRTASINWDGSNPIRPR